ncbi:hypothetical protein FNF27_03351 [Cafeteria roenbergensis]|uniref:Uncharacterized protein n=4 Tax=Cafeteria roenbergensis TaxID=33653 RepID=A0A5A8EAV5_CAFRO|nr:hypothetical protein FNF27_03351 [Cafeteria roenbergensis]
MPVDGGEVAVGLAMIAVAGALSGSYTSCLKAMPYLPWENAWGMYAMWAMVVLPWILVAATTDNLGEVYAGAPQSAYLATILFGGSWGLGSVTFGIGTTMVGNSLGFSIILGMTAVLGSVIPLVVLNPDKIATPAGYADFAALAVAAVGLAMLGWAGMLRERERAAAAAGTARAGDGWSGDGKAGGMGEEEAGADAGEGRKAGGSSAAPSAAGYHSDLTQTSPLLGGDGAGAAVARAAAIAPASDPANVSGRAGVSARLQQRSARASGAEDSSRLLQRGPGRSHSDTDDDEFGNDDDAVTGHGGGLDDRRGGSGAGGAGAPGRGGGGAGGAAASCQSCGGNFAIGLAMCVASGVLSPMLNLALTFGSDIKDRAATVGHASPAMANNAVWAVAVSAGAVANAIYCSYLVTKNGGWHHCCGGRAADAPPLPMAGEGCCPACSCLESRTGGLVTLLWPFGMAVFWLAGTVLYGVGAGRMGPLGEVLGWPIFIMLMVLTGNVSGIMAGEWTGASWTALRWLAAGLVVLTAAAVIIGVGASLD